MAIVSSDIKYRLSGGSANANPATSLGGVISSTDAPATTFDDVSSAEAQAGSVEYRCVYVRNTHGTLTLVGAKVWIQANTTTPSSDVVAIGLGTSAVNGTEQTVANETTAPTGVTFSAAANEGAGLTIGDLAPGATKAVWIRRTVLAGASAVAESFTLRVKGDTLP